MLSKANNDRYSGVVVALRLLRSFLEIDQTTKERWWQVEDLADNARISPRTCYRLLSLFRDEGLPLERRLHEGMAFYRLQEDNLVDYLRQPFE